VSPAADSEDPRRVKTVPSQIHYGASIQVTDAHGVPIHEHQVLHHIGPGETLAVTLPAALTDQAENELLAGILRRLLTDEDAYRNVAHRNGHGGTLDLDGSITLTPRETRWLLSRYSKELTDGE
jgi:hypothetical protein